MADSFTHGCPCPLDNLQHSATLLGGFDSLFHYQTFASRSKKKWPAVVIGPGPNVFIKPTFSISQEESSTLKILLVYPQYPDTFWSFKHALKLIWKKASFPPLGLLTIAAMLPKEWEKKVVDLNVHSLSDQQIKWADYVFISAMVVQKESARELVARCKKLGVKIVAGGPLFTTDYEEFKEVDHFLLGEAENIISDMVADLAKGCARHIYSSHDRPCIDKVPVPLWSLIHLEDYTTMSLQYSRGCPFDCEFCDIVFLNGRVPRTKNQSQVLTELAALHKAGWRGPVFMVDDNFIGNKKKLKQEILPAIIEWMEKHKHPFSFTTETSINLADDRELMELMVKAGFVRVFIGIESPSEESLQECHKLQNKNRDLLASIKTIQNQGLEVMGGFIIGFDSDQASIFKTQINFIQKSGIATAMVGLLNAPKGTRLYQRLEAENRLLNTFSGDNTDTSLNFIPKMDRELLLRGYAHVLDTIYSPKHYYDRVRIFLREYQPRQKIVSHVKLYQIFGGINIFWTLGFKEKGRWQYWKFMISNSLKKPRTLPLSIELAVYGYHFRKMARRYISNSPLQERP